jgi:hypothetical protein
VDEFYNFIVKSTKKEDNLLISDKLNKLFENKLLIPIGEDFMRIHKDNEQYESYKKDDVKVNKYNSKIKFILNRVNTYMMKNDKELTTEE